MRVVGILLAVLVVSALILGFGQSIFKGCQKAGDEKAIEDFQQAQEDLDKAKRGGGARDDAESQVQKAREKLEKRGINPDSHEVQAWLKGLWGSAKSGAAKGAEKGKSGLSRFVDENQPATGDPAFDAWLHKWAKDRQEKEGGHKESTVTPSSNKGPYPWDEGISSQSSPTDGK